MRVLVTGGAGFIGSNLTRRLLNDGHEVTVLDNLSRAGVDRNVEWLSKCDGRGLSIVRGDVRDVDDVGRVVAGVDVVFHLAAQVAVTTSVDDPRSDFDINLLGTFNVLEAVRRQPESRRPKVVYTSTNKVYGRMEDVEVADRGDRYAYSALPGGVPESQPLDFHSPYGCSKGAADQYVHDYARIYDIDSVVFRMSCIYGPRQFGNEDQGWVAHFLISALLGRALTIYGDGKQVRDILFVDDLVEAFLAVVDRMPEVRGRVFNIGGGPENTVSLLELMRWLEQRGCQVERSFDAWRAGDQPVYVSDISAAKSSLGWSPQVSVDDGLERLWTWIVEHRKMFED